MGGLRPVAFIYACCQMGTALIFVAFLVGSLLFSGAQVTRSQAPQWDPAIAFPVFPVPAWLLIGLAAAGVIAALVWVFTSRPAEAQTLTGAVGATVVAAAAPLFFILAFSAQGEPAEPYWVASCLTVVSGALIVVAAVLQGARRKRENEQTQDSEIGA